MHDSRSSGARRSIVAGAVLVSLAVAPAAASAADGSTTIRLAGTAAKSLDASKVKLSGLKPAKATRTKRVAGARVTLPVSGGKVGSKVANVNHKGRLRLKAGKRAVTLSRVRVRLEKKHPRITARLNGSTITLLTLKPAKRRPAKLDAGQDTARITSAAASLPRSTARRIQRALKLKRTLRSGRIARVTIKADVSKPAKPAPTPAPQPAPQPQPVPPTNTTPAPPTPTTTTTTTTTTPTNPPVDPPNPNPEPTTCAGTSIAAIAGANWGIKESFRNYVTGPIAHGSVDASDGAEPTDDGTYCFSPTGSASYDPGSGSISVAVSGSVHFAGHDAGSGPLLELEIENIRVQSTDGISGRLTADVRSKSLSTGTFEEFPDVHLADLNLSHITPSDSGNLLTWVDVPAILTADGAPAFGGFYAAGDALDPITFAAPNARLAASDATWTQAKYYASGDPGRTWLGYLTNSSGGFPANGTMTPSDGATGDTVTPASTAGLNTSYRVRFSPGSSTVIPTARVGVIRYHGLVTFESAPHGITTTVRNPRIVFDGTSMARVFATGLRTLQGSPTGPYDDSEPVFTIAVGAATDNGDGTSTFQDATAVVATTGHVFPGSTYPAGNGDLTMPFGSFSITVPNP